MPVYHKIERFPFDPANDSLTIVPTTIGTHYPGTERKLFTVIDGANNAITVPAGSGLADAALKRFPQFDLPAFHGFGNRQQITARAFLDLIERQPDAACTVAYIGNKP